MEEVWKNKFKSKEVEFPSDIAIEYCNQLYELTNKLKEESKSNYKIRYILNNIANYIYIYIYAL